MQTRLAKVDPVTAARLAPQDSQRIQRALEVWESSGQPLSSFHAVANKAAKGLTGGVLFSLEPADRAWLHARIADRFDAMLRLGLVAEVKALKKKYRLNASMPSMRAVGYRQVWEFLEGEIDEATMRARAVTATRQLAKRQLTWLRSFPDLVRLDTGGAQDPAVALHLLLDEGRELAGR